MPGAKGVESRFFDLAELVRCERVLVADASFIPSEEERCVVALPVDTYRVQFSVMDYGPDWRIARLRITSSDDVRRGRAIGQTWTDTARTGVCDIDLLQPAWGLDAETSYQRVALRRLGLR